MNHVHRSLRADITEGQLLIPPPGHHAGPRTPAPAGRDDPAKPPTVIDADDDGEDVVLVIELICDPTLA
ncbi:hypothetical protein [Nocardia gipuzkoensis]|uniref:hypothetical protein n=1 Tax=Nocardia gipuzkoensis TaxID=2749991 RepID=UPI0015EEB64C|nr:hypothetical protein [Nocardia gipuzkoensis]